MALREKYSEIRSLGADLVAISPQLQRFNQELSKERKLPFLVLGDLRNEIPRKYNVAFTLPDSMKWVYSDIAVTVLEKAFIDQMTGFKKRFEWFLENRRDPAQHITWTDADCSSDRRLWLLAIPSRDRRVRVLRHMLDESEFLSPCSLRPLSKFHARPLMSSRQTARSFASPMRPSRITPPCSAVTPTGATCFYLTSSSMGKPAGGWARATKPGGRRWSHDELKV